MHMLASSCKYVAMKTFESKMLWFAISNIIPSEPLDNFFFGGGGLGF